MADDLYDRDVYHWTQAQAEALRAHGRALDNLAYDHIAEALEDLGSSQRQKAESLVRQIIAHLYKLAASRSPSQDHRAGEVIEIRRAGRRRTRWSTTNRAWWSIGPAAGRFPKSWVSRTTRSPPMSGRWSMKRVDLGLLAALATLLAGCHDNLAAATAADANTCYRLPGGATAKKVALADDDENLETCAMHLEGYRLQHRLPQAVGFYEDHFIYNTSAGITAAATNTGIHYSVYTKAEQADLDGKLRQLIDQAGASGPAAPANATGG